MQETLLQSLPSNPLLAAGWVVARLPGIPGDRRPARCGAPSTCSTSCSPCRCAGMSARVSFSTALELGLRQGKTAEDSIIAVSASRDRSFGARFYLLAEYLAGGHTTLRGAAAGAPPAPAPSRRDASCGRTDRRYHQSAARLPAGAQGWCIPGSRGAELRDSGGVRCQPGPRADPRHVQPLHPSQVPPNLF